MLHELKLALCTKGDKFLLETDQRLREADRILAELRCWFPQLQAAFEENERIWASLAYNISTMAKTAQQVFAESHPMQAPLDELANAGQCVLKPAAGDALHDERARTVAELRAFNDCIRQLRATQMDCVFALKNKQYYASKLESIRSAESARRRKITDKEADRRLRNEQKLSDYATQLAFQTEKLQTELEKALDKKQLLLEMVMNTYVRAQHFYFSLDPMQTVLPLLTKSVSPRALYELYGYTATTRLASLAYDSGNSDDLEQPPRAPSPVLHKAQSSSAKTYVLRQSSLARLPGPQAPKSAPLFRKGSVHVGAEAHGPRQGNAGVRFSRESDSTKNRAPNFRGVYRANSSVAEMNCSRLRGEKLDASDSMGGKARSECDEGGGAFLTASAVRTASAHNDRLQHLSSLGMGALGTRTEVSVEDTTSVDVQVSARTDSEHTENNARMYPAPAR